MLVVIFRARARRLDAAYSELAAELPESNAILYCLAR